jgi:phospholipid/cholesterol/gamma-HCH transport system substrate-binding protein
MSNRTSKNIKLGAFVLAGLVLLVTALYYIGKDTNLFGKNYKLKAHFDNVQGLSAGNNIRYAGIQVGTVSKVKILSDTLIEVTLLIKQSMKAYIHQNDWVSIGTDGLVGNRLLNIIPAKDGSSLAQPGDLLRTRITVSTENMLETLDRTNRNVLQISEDLKQTMQRINAGNALWSILNDQSLPDNLRASGLAIRHAALQASQTTVTLHEIVNGVKAGRGSLGLLLNDTAIASQLATAASKARHMMEKADAAAVQLREAVTQVKQYVGTEGSAVSALLTDTSLAASLQNSLTNIESGTASFNQSMEALKHNFLLRGYFRKQEKKRKKEAISAQSTDAPY